MEDPSNPMNADKDDDFSLIDGSELDDLFVSMSEPRFMDNKANSVDGEVNVPEKPDAERHRKNEKYNLRKSLAWDSAFFTNAGVLDAEELSSIIDGSNAGKHEMQRLPGIEEDVSKSTDSLSTFESDSLTLESLEADLFVDIRASIQRSGNSSKMRKSNLNDKLEETSHLGKKTTEIKHGNLVKPKSTPKKLNANLQGDVKLSKLGPSRDQVRKPVATRRDSTSSILKPAAAIGKGSSMGIVPVKVPAAKRMSISAGRVKSDASNVGNVTGRVTPVLKGDRPGDSRSIIPKTVSSAKSSSGLSTTTRTGISSARSSCDSTSSSSSVSSRILPLNGLQGKISRPVSIPPPGTKSRIPSRGQLKGKHPPNTSRISAKLSGLMLSPSVSPTSSISEWSSSSSTVNANQEHSVSNDCSSLHRTVSLDSIASQDSQIHPKQQASCENEIEVGGAPGISAQGLSAGNESVSDPVSAKPSGLRMPSPKIGFFDGVKSGGRTQNAVGSMQSRSRLSSSRLPRSTTGSTSPGGVPNKGRIGHASVKTTALAAANANPDAQRSNARRTATGGGCQEGMLTAPGNDSKGTATGNVLETPSLKTSAKNNSLSAKLPVGEKHHSDPGSSSRKKSGLASPSKIATPDGISQCEGNHVSFGVKADHHSMEINDDSTMVNPHVLHALINGDTVITELHPVSMSEVGNSIKGDENAEPVVVNGGHEKTNEKNDPICAVVTGQQSTVVDPVSMTEEVCNAIKVDENADPVVVNGCKGATNEKIDPICDAVTDQQSAVVDPVSMTEEVCNAIKADENADPVAVNGCNGATKENINPICAVVTDQESAILDPISMSEEVCNAIEVDENVDPVVVNGGGHESTIEKNDPICDMVTDQKSIFADPVSMSEAVHNAIKLDENADQVAANVGGEATNEKHDPICVVINDQQATVADTVSIFDEVRDTIQADVNADPELALNGCNGATKENIDPICAVVADQERAVLDPVSMSEEVCNAIEVDENADPVVVNGGHESTNEKNDPICPDQRSIFVDPVSMSEEVGNAIKLDENADQVVANGGGEATNEKHDSICVVVTDQQATVADTVSVFDKVRDTIQADVNADPEFALNGWHEAANEKNDPICAVVADQQSTFVDPVSMSEEVCNAIETDENADLVVANGCHETTNENDDDPICAMVTDEQSTFAYPVSISVEVHNAIKIDQNADPVAVNGCNVATDESNDPISAVVTDQQSAFVEPVSLSEEVYNATITDENADPMVANGGHEATNEKNDPICDVVADQQSGFVEQQVNGLIENVEVLCSKRELCDEMDWNIEPQSNVDFVSGSLSPAVSCTVETSGLNQKREAADLPKQIDLPASAKKLESNPGSRTPFADKNSLPDTYAMDVLLKSFSSLSLDNAHAKDVETRMT